MILTKKKFLTNIMHENGLNSKIDEIHGISN